MRLPTLSHRPFETTLTDGLPLQLGAGSMPRAPLAPAAQCRVLPEILKRTPARCRP